jgi:hypothetical protein
MARTKLKPNGDPGHLEIEWSPLMKWAAGIAGALLVSAVLATFGLHVRFAVLEAAVHRLEDHDKERVTRPEFERHTHAARESER